MGHFRGLGRDVLLIILSVAVRHFIAGYMQVVRPIYLAEIGFDPVLIGFLLSIATAVGALRSGIVGFLADIYRKKIFVMLGGFFSFLRHILYIFTTDFSLLAVAEGAGSLAEGGGAGQPAIGALIADKTPVEKRAEAFSSVAIADAVATAAGSPMAAAPIFFRDWLEVGAIESYRPLFILGALLSLASMTLVLGVTEGPPLRGERGILPSKSSGTIMRFSLIRATEGLGFGIIMPLAPLWFYLRFGVGTEVLGLTYAIIRGLSIFSYLMIPRLSSKWGAVNSLVKIRLLSSFLIVAVPLLPDFVLAAAFFTAFRVFIVTTFPIRQSLITEIVDPRELSTAIGLSNLSMMASEATAPVVGGYLIKSLSMTLPFVGSGGLIALDGILYYVFFRGHKSPTKI